MAKRTLIIAENKSELKQINSCLRHHGFRNILLVQNGSIGISIAKSEAPELVIIDVELPDTDGFVVTEQIRGALGKNVKIILMTGNFEMIDSGRARDVGADDFTVKTSDFAGVIESAKNILAFKAPNSSNI